MVTTEYIDNYPEKIWLQFLILRLIYENPTYGYQLIKDIHKISQGKHIVKSGTMYTTLRRMEKNNLLNSVWEKNKSGPNSRIYNITIKGKLKLKSLLKMVVERKTIIDKMIKFYKKEFKE
jgi:PadR family transcriptional regulator PadR